MRIIGTLLIIVAAMLQADFTIAASLKGLRGGNVFVKAECAGEVRVHTKPTFGWKEHLSVYDSKGGLVHRVYPSRDKTSDFVFRLDNSGIYKIRLSRSYVASLSSEQSKLMYAPLLHETSFQNNTVSKLYFNVPVGTGNFTANLENRRSLQGQDCTAVIAATNSGSTQESYRVTKKGFSAQDIAVELGVKGPDAQQSLSDLSPEVLPSQFFPAKLPIDYPLHGTWETVLSPGRVGFWLTGVPNLFAASPDDLFSLSSSAVNIPLKKGTSLSPPILGAVGNFGENGKYGSILNTYGVRGDKIFLHGKGNTRSLAQKGSIQFGDHTLFVLRSMPESIYRMSMPKRAERFAQWAAREVRSFINLTNFPLSKLTMQPFNEPNLEASLDEYLVYMDSIVSTFKTDPQLAQVRIGGPALGSGDAPTAVDWTWITRLLQQFGDQISTIIWNCYKISGIDETFEYANAIKKTKEIIDTYGGKQDIIIGATNRMGGLAPNALFNSTEGGTWWASCLMEVISSNAVHVLNYYKMVDSGSREKGLFTPSGTPKSQALVQQAVDKVITQDKLYSVESGSPLVKAILGVNRTSAVMFVLNQAWFPVQLDLFAIGKTVTIHDVFTGKELASDASIAPNQCVIVTLR